MLCDRYTTSNAVHQASKLSAEERDTFFRWLYEFEFGKLGLPKPDLVLYLDMPTGASVSLLRHREAATHTQADIHERDNAYLAACRDCLPCGGCAGLAAHSLHRKRAGADGEGHPPGCLECGKALSDGDKTCLKS